MLRREIPRAQIADRAELVGPALAAREREHGALQVLAVGERHVARAVGAAGDGAVDLAAVDAVRELRHRREAGAAGALQVVRRRGRMQPRAERRFARQVPVARVLDHRARGDLADPLALQCKFFNQRLERRGEHVLI